MSTVKTSQKSVFHPCQAHILSRLDVLVLYIFFWEEGFQKYQVSAQNPKALAFGFTEKCMSTVKTSRKSVFHSREAHILSWIDVSVLYINF
jgi:hypothetical protein